MTTEPGNIPPRSPEEAERQARGERVGLAAGDEDEEETADAASLFETEPDAGPQPDV